MKSTETDVAGRYLILDTAYKDAQQNDFTGYTVLELMHDYRVLTRWVDQDKIQSHLLPDLVTRLATEWHRDGKLKGVIIEEAGSGITTLQNLRAFAPAWLKKMLHGFHPGRHSKEDKVRAAAQFCEKSCVLLPYPSAAAPWLFAFEGSPDPLDKQSGQLYTFPAIDHDDMIDSFATGILFLRHYLTRGYEARTRQAA